MKLRTWWWHDRISLYIATIASKKLSASIGWIWKVVDVPLLFQIRFSKRVKRFWKYWKKYEVILMKKRFIANLRLWKKKKKIIIRLRVWAIEEESVVMKAEICHNEEITCFNTSSKGNLLVTGSTDLSLKLWQIDNGFLMQVTTIVYFNSSSNYPLVRITSL